MQSVIQLKNDCGEKLKALSQIKGVIDNEIILKDLEQISLNKNDFEVRVRNGILDIIDKRGLSFGWGFEIQYLEPCLRIGDAFTFNNDIKAVSMLNENVNEEIILEIIKINRELDNSISFLKNKDNIKQIKYEYYNCHDSITCENIQEVYKIIIERRYN